MWYVALVLLARSATVIAKVFLHAIGCRLQGDAIASLLKRGAGAKDSGSLFPGHGGFLDRVDSLVLSAPVLCVLIAR